MTLLAGIPESTAALQEPAERSCSPILRHSSARPDCGKSHLPVDMWFGAQHAEGFSLLPVVNRTFVRSAYAIERNNGPTWAGRGLSGSLSTGIRFKSSKFTAALALEATGSTNSAFAVARTLGSPDALDYPWQSNTIDWPQRHGTEGSARLGLWGSFLEFSPSPALRIGASLESRTAGSGRRFNLILTSTGEPPPTLYLEFGRLTTPVGAFSGSVEWSRLASSEYWSRRETAVSTELMSLSSITWQSAGAGAFQLSGTVVYRQPWDAVTGIGSLFRFVRTSSLQAATEIGEDGLLTLDASVLLVPGTMIYATLGRGDFWGSVEDLVTEPDHSAFWLAGADIGLPTGAPVDRVIIERASTSASDTHQGPRDVGMTLYRHTVMPKGHTNRGQLLGASIGPGAKGTFLGAYSGDWGVELEHIRWDIDTYTREIRETYEDSGPDRELRLALRVNRDILSDVSARAAIGAATRQNRAYARFTENSGDLPRTEHNLWIDFAMSWTPPQLFNR